MASLRFYPSDPGPALRPTVSKPFGFGFERTRQWLSAPSVLKLRVTAFASSFNAGQGARKQSRLWI
jgi:hypothetical protein